MKSFTKALPAIRKKVALDLKNPHTDPRDRACAAVVRLIDHTGMRIGSEKYAQGNDTFGASSLRRGNVIPKPDGKTVSLNFRGKHGVGWERDIEDPELHRAVSHFHAQGTSDSDRLFPAT